MCTVDFCKQIYNYTKRSENHQYCTTIYKKTYTIVLSSAYFENWKVGFNASMKHNWVHWIVVFDWITYFLTIVILKIKPSPQCSGQLQISIEVVDVCGGGGGWEGEGGLENYTPPTTREYLLISVYDQILNVKRPYRIKRLWHIEYRNKLLYVSVCYLLWSLSAETGSTSWILTRNCK